MKYTEHFLVLILALCLTAGISQAKTNKNATKIVAESTNKNTSVDTVDKAGKEKNEKKNDSQDGFKVLPDLDELYAEIADVVRLDEKGQQRLLKLQEQKTRKLEEFENKFGEKIVELERKLDQTTNDKQKVKIILTLSKISSNRENLQRKYDKQAFCVLRIDQIIAWNSYELWKVISPDLQFDGELEMTDDQVEKSKTICSQIASRTGANMRISRNPEKMKRTIAQIGRQVLTKQQQKAYLHQQRIKQQQEEANTKTITVVETRGGCCHH